MEGDYSVTDEWPEKYVEGIRLFNEEEFFECHDVLEELWAETLGEDKKFLQGLIQASVALFHFGNENLGGARKLYHASLEKLEPYGDAHMGLDLVKFKSDFKHCFEEVLQAGNEYPKDVVIQDERVPRMEVDF
jgi:predicted metal-dependent hydrolase